MSKYLPEGWTQNKIDDALELQRNAPKQEGTNMKNQAKDSLENATERPWKIGITSGSVAQINNNNDSKIVSTIATIDGSPDMGVLDKESHANAALIVRAVNSHDALVEALDKAEKRIIELSPQGYIAPERWDIQSALKLAKGE